MAHEVISKAIENKRNHRLCKLGLECKVEDSVFTTNHYGTSILKVDLYEGRFWVMEAIAKHIHLTSITL